MLIPVSCVQSVLSNVSWNMHNIYVVSQPRESESEQKIGNKHQECKKRKS